MASAEAGFRGRSILGSASAMAIQQQVFLRYRSEGHLRFALPSVLCSPPYAGQIIAGLRRAEGVYRVDLYRRQGKLSIRYLDSVCDFPTLVRRLHTLLQEITPQFQSSTETTALVPAPPRPIRERVRNSRPMRWLRQKYQEAKETATAMGILAKRGLKGGSSPISKRPRWLSEFLNDLLILYLIRVHWPLISRLWLRDPWRYRYEWMATLYLIYLLVRSRIPRPA